MKAETVKGGESMELRKEAAQAAAIESGLCKDDAEGLARFDEFWMRYLDKSDDIRESERVYLLSLLDDERKKRSEEAACYRSEKKFAAFIYYLFGAALVLINRLL